MVQECVESCVLCDLFCFFFFFGGSTEAISSAEQGSEGVKPWTHSVRV